jgi:hypothetical protein
VTSCYDENGQAIACAGTGQDAEYQAGCRISPRFELDIGPDGLDDRVDSTIIDDTVTDLCTGLEWTRWRQQDSPPGPPGGTWCGWVEYCKVDLNAGGGFAGKTGWRCANVREISTLVQYGLPIPATEVENLIDPVFGKFSRRVSGAAASTLYGEKSFYSARYINGIEGSTAPGDLEASTTVFAVRDAD